MTANMMDSLINRFRTKIKGTILYLYNSSVNYTNDLNGKYYHNMDTAFKFYETTVRGKKASNWTLSPTITGYDSEDSFVNYYDNGLEIPVNGKGKKIYIRHIDVTGLSEAEINSDTVYGRIVKNKSIDNVNGTSGRAIKISSWVGTTPVFSGYPPTTVPDSYNMYNYFTDYYEMEIDNVTDYVIANIKYNNDGYLDDAGNAKRVSYLSDNKTKFEQEVLDKYDVLGYNVGVGATLEEAEEKRNENLNNGYVEGTGDNTTYIVNPFYVDDYIVIDFYYRKRDEVKNVYVRHIDVTDLSKVTSTNVADGLIKNKSVYSNKGTKGRAIKITEWLNEGLKFDSYVSPSEAPFDNFYNSYTDYYKMIGDSTYSYVLGNIKYSSYGYIDKDGEKKTASYLGSSMSDLEKTIATNYNCLGYAIGKGNSLEEAEIARNNDIDDGYTLGTGNYTSYVVPIYEEKDYIVIDFYYSKENSEQDIKKLYVRHINLDKYDGKITTANVKSAIENGEVLPGYGKVQVFPSTQNSWVDKTSETESGYQEIFKVGSEKTVRIYPSSSDNICIGTNITTSTTEIEDAKSNMEKYRLDKGLYNSYDTALGYCETSSKDYYILVDFYYVSRDKGNILERPEIGRLSFYTLDNQENPETLSGDSSKEGNINTKVNNNSSEIYDVIPSGETLKLSVDNAYVYMLGAVNIQEKNSKGTETLKYTIKQPYVVYYKDWSGECNNCGCEYDNKKTSKCSRKIGTGEYDEEGNEKTQTCNGTIENSYSWEFAEGSVSKKYNYTIPYDVIYYKVKNMRLYTVNRIELLDNYENDGLPLFDGGLHTIYPTKEYRDMFSDSKVRFNQSSITSKLVSSQDGSDKENEQSEKVLNQLELRYYNERGDIEKSTAEDAANTKVKLIMNTSLKNHSEAAAITDFETDSELIEAEEATNNSVKINTNGSYDIDKNSPLMAKLTVTNDNIYIKDDISNKDIYIIGEENEKESVVWINLYEYTKNVTTTGDGTSTDRYSYSEDKVDTISTSTSYPKSIRGNEEDAVGSKYLPNNNLTNKDYFEEKALNIPISRLNGKAYSYGKIYYSLLTNSNKLNFDVDDTSKDFNWNRSTVNGAGTTIFYDTEMYNTEGSANPTKITNILPSSLENIVWEYGENNAENKDADIVDVFTPIKFTTKILKNATDENRYVDHTVENDNIDIKQIQKNARFTIQMKTGTNSQYTGLSTSKYLKEYYVKFDFDVQDIIIYDVLDPKGRRYSPSYAKSETWIGPIYNIYDVDNNGKLEKADNGIVKISAFALEDANEATSVVNQESNEYTVRGVAYNAPSLITYDLHRGRLNMTVLNAISYSKIITSENIENDFAGTGNNYENDKYHNDYYSGINETIKGRSNYIAETVVATENLGRVYDFKVTDILDVDWKNIFRQSSSASSNKHTSNAYYAGIYKWNVYTTEPNDMEERDVSEIGATNQQILPVGPYKNKNSTYIKAPKLGYKFSFDLKTTGARTNKQVIIEPKFYYISKDAQTYIDSNHIKLLYKNSNNRYVDVKNYNLYFVPDDGYRLTFEGTDESYRFSSSSLSRASTKLGTPTKITLNNKMMQLSDNGFVQIWYGEYKLPNSTIAVELDNDGKYDINKKLKDGYIGIVFDIVVNEYKEGAAIKDENITRVLNYSQDDKNYNGDDNTNTSQWDYEGYLGFNKTNIGSNVTNLTLPLENGTWEIKYQTSEDAKKAVTDGIETKVKAAYQDIKGTVVLYDLDAKASNDYN